MSLSTALNIAQSALLATSRQTSIVSRNVTNASNPDYNRRLAMLQSDAPGVHMVSIQRAADMSLFRANLGAVSSYEGQASLRTAIETMTQAVNGIDSASSPATSIGDLYEALQFYAANPSNASIAERAIDAARQVVRSLNNGAAAVNAARSQADRNIAESVADLNGLLAEFKTANDAVVSATVGGRDTSDALDKRDALLKRISEHVPISTITRDNNDMVITTTSGTTLFETIPREVSFQAKLVYGATTVGNQVMVDGVPLPVGTGGDTNSAGRIAGYLQMRDQIAPTFQAQLDEIARGLVTAFAETDQSGGALPARAGLFTWSGGPALPAAGTVSPGLAGTISINAAMDSTVGGNAFVLRDGGANGAAYVANTSNAASFSALLIGYQAKLDEPMTFDGAAGAGVSASVMTYSTNSISWLEGIRKSADQAELAKSALVARTSEALSNATGVNVDQEMALLLELEHSYGASARLLKTVDEMLNTLLAMVD